MDSKDSVRSRLRATSFDADDRALLNDQLAERQQQDALAAITPEPFTPRPGAARTVLDAVLDALVRSAYGVDGAVRYVRARPLTALAVAAGVGALLARLGAARRKPTARR